MQKLKAPIYCKGCQKQKEKGIYNDIFCEAHKEQFEKTETKIKGALKKVINR